MEYTIDLNELVRRIKESFNNVKLPTTDPTTWSEEWRLIVSDINKDGWSPQYTFKHEYKQSIINKVDYLNFKHQRLRYRYNDECLTNSDKCLENKCRIDDLYESLENKPTKAVQTELLTLLNNAEAFCYEQYTILSNLQKTLLTHSDLIKRYYMIRRYEDELKYVQDFRKMYVKKAKECRQLFIDLCIALTPLKLGTYPVIFISEFIPEIKFVSQYDKVKIYESIVGKIEKKL